MANSASQPRIAIIGGGPAGLTIARLFQVHGIDCTIFEAGKDRSSDQGGSLDLHEDAGILVLKAAKLHDKFLEHARPEGEAMRILTEAGEVLMDEEDEITPEMQGRPEIDRALLLALLEDSLEPDTIRWDHRLESVRGGPETPFTLTFRNGHSEEFDLLIGADGVWSTVRPLVTDQKPSYAGISGIDVGIANATERFPHLAARCGKGLCFTVGRNKAIICQKLGDGSTRTYGFVRLPESWGEEFDFSDPKSAIPAFVEEHYGDWESDAKDSLLQADLESAVKRPIWGMPVGVSWKSQPRVTLIGDAAHVMPPFAGAGVNVSMQDALVLATNIIAGADNIADAIAKYEADMFLRAQKDAAKSFANLNFIFSEKGAPALVEILGAAKQGNVNQ